MATRVDDPAEAEAERREALGPRWIESPGADWERCETELEAAGFPLPFWHRQLGVRCVGAGPWRFLAVGDPGGVCRFGLAVREGTSRALPGHRILRVERLGAAGGAARTAGLAALTRHARRTPRVLRLEIASFARDPRAGAGLAAELEGLGFRRSATPRHYTDTIVVELEPSEAEILASFHKQTRKNLRRIEREPFEVRPLTDPAYATRLDRLLAETMARSAGPYAPEDWETRLAAAAERPALSRLVGLFRLPGSGPEALLAFGWACHHGDHVEYCTTASTRIPGSRLPLTHPLAWDLIRWARSAGAPWFDFGGVTHGGLGSQDQLGGISDFKRSFSQQVETVGSEWVFEPRPVRARLARSLGSLRRRLRGDGAP